MIILDLVSSFSVAVKMLLFYLVIDFFFIYHGFTPYITDQDKKLLGKEDKEEQYTEKQKKRAHR